MAASVTPAFVKSIPDHRSACFLKKCDGSGRELATGAFEANGNHFDQ